MVTAVRHAYFEYNKKTPYRAIFVKKIRDTPEIQTRRLFPNNTFIRLQPKHTAPCALTATYCMAWYAAIAPLALGAGSSISPSPASLPPAWAAGRGGMPGGVGAGKRRWFRAYAGAGFGKERHLQWVKRHGRLSPCWFLGYYKYTIALVIVSIGAKITFLGVSSPLYFVSMKFILTFRFDCIIL
jgi:hypothetical protein